MNSLFTGKPLMRPPFSYGLHPALVRKCSTLLINGHQAQLLELLNSVTPTGTPAASNLQSELLFTLSKMMPGISHELLAAWDVDKVAHDGELIFAPFKFTDLYEKAIHQHNRAKAWFYYSEMEALQRLFSTKEIKAGQYLLQQAEMRSILRQKYFARFQLTQVNHLKGILHDFMHS